MTMQFDESLERAVIQLIATERIYIPVSSMDGKLKRQRSELAQDIPIEQKYRGERVYARIDDKEVSAKARTMRQAIDEFAEKYPKHGKVLNGLIEEKRLQRQKTLYFGMNDGCRLTEADYMGVMTGLGFTELTSQRLYPELMDISRKLSKKRQEAERSILIGKFDED